MELFKKRTPRRLLTLALAIVMVIGLGSTSFAAFSDIPAGHEYEGFATDLHEKGIISGYADGTFGLNDNLRRGQAAKMIAKAAGLDYEGKEADFEDVPEGHEMSPYIAALVEVGAISGFEDGTFKMHNNITRRQIAKIIVEAFELTKGDKVVELSDLDALDETTRSYIEILASNDIVSGYADGSFGPNDQVKRGQFAKILSLAMEAVEEAEAIAVESVSAITDSIYKQKDQQLEIEVNGDKVVTVEELVEEGYKVEFLFNKTFAKDSAEKTKGLVNGTTIGNFKYAVKVTPEEGDAITSEWVDVKVIDAVKIVEVVEVGLEQAGEAWELDYITENDTGLKFVALSGKNVEGTLLTDEDEGVTLPTATSIKALNPTIAYANEDKEIEVVPGQTGKAKFEVKFNAIEEPVTVTLDVKAARKPASIKEDGETFRIEAKKNASVEYTVLDQYGEENATEVTVKVLDADEEEVANNLNSLNLKAGTYTVEFEYDGEKIGSFTVIATDVSGDPDEYTLTAEETEVDINVEGEIEVLYININAFIEETKLSGFDTSALKVEVSDDKIAEVEIEGNKIEFTAKKNSVDRLESEDVVVTLYTQVGDFRTNHATITITVKNSLEPEYQVTELSIKDNKDVIELDAMPTVANVVAKLTTGDEKNPLVEAMIKEDTLKLVNKRVEDGKTVGDVLFTIVEANGGKVFSFPVEIVVEIEGLISSVNKVVEPNGTLWLSVVFGLDTGHKINNQMSLKVSLVDKDDNVIAVNVLNGKGLEDNTNGTGLSTPFIYKVTEHGDYEGYTPSNDGKGDLDKTPGTGVGQRDEHGYRGPSAWNRSANDGTQPAKVVLEYVIDGIVYVSEYTDVPTYNSGE